MQLSIQSIHSLSAEDFSMQLYSCIGQINLSADENVLNRRIVKITVFTSCSDDRDYLLKMDVLNETLAQFEECQAPFSLVSQAPIVCETILEVWIIEYSGTELSFTFTRGEQSSALQIDCADFSCQFTNQFSAKNNQFKENIQEAFNLLDSALINEGFDCNEIVRQWNYIENITLLDTVSDKRLQNYQIFNDKRTLFYEKSDFMNGYPSATGIGIANGGCTIDTIVLKEKKGNSVIPITNSQQVDAHRYSSNVLVGNAIEEVRKASTPKFERAKYIQFGDSGFLFISGTASIIGELTVFPEDVANQTITTFQNIDHLISVNNLNNNKISVISQPRLLNYRVYLKNESDYPVVKSLCDAHFGIENGIFVKTDICRSNLLIEIEANYRV